MRREIAAVLREQEQLNAGFHAFLLRTEIPGGVALRERIEGLQFRIMKLRLVLEPYEPP